MLVLYQPVAGRSNSPRTFRLFAAGRVWANIFTNWAASAQVRWGVSAGGLRTNEGSRQQGIERWRSCCHKCTKGEWATRQFAKAYRKFANAQTGAGSVSFFAPPSLTQPKASCVYGLYLHSDTLFILKPRQRLFGSIGIVKSHQGLFRNKPNLVRVFSGDGAMQYLPCSLADSFWAASGLGQKNKIKICKRK